MAESDVFDFPKLDFGRRTMDAGELEQALVLQLRLHSTNAVNETGITHPNPQKPKGDLFPADYQKYRSFAVAWFAEITPFRLAFNEKHHSVFMPAVNLMDRYITVSVDFGEDPRQLFKNIKNIRAACFSLSVKMHAVNTELDLSELVEHQGFPTSVQGVEEAEKQIIIKLHGDLFPDNAENMISILCKCLILKCISRRASHLPISTLDRHITERAAEFLTKTALDLELLRFERWKCIAVCCLLGAIDVYAESPLEMIYLEDELMALMEKLKPVEFTREELHDLKRLLTVGCVVCSSSIYRRVTISLFKVTSLSCAECRKLRQERLWRE